MISSLQKGISLTRIKTYKSIALRDAVVGQSVNMLVWEKKLSISMLSSVLSKNTRLSLHMLLCMVLMLQRNDVQLGI